MHIPHLFELPSVSSAQTIYDTFLELYEYITNNPSKVTQKFDGMNISFKVMDGRIVLLSKNNQILNIDQVQNENVKQIYKTILKELSDLYKTNQGPFLRLNLDEPDLFCSCEYISKKINLIEYSKDLFIIHGIFKYVSRNEPIKKVNVSQTLLNEFVNVAQKTTSEVLTLTTLAAYPSTIKPLLYVGKKMTFPSIVEGGQDPTLEQLVELGQNPSKKFLKKQIYLDFIHEDKIIEESGFYDSIILLFLNMKLGQMILDSIEFEEQYSEQIEGIVIEGFQGIPLCKITGNFYLDTFVQKNKFNSYYFSICGMKPPHKGHYHFINESIRRAKKYNSDFHLIIGDKRREGFDINQTKQILSLFFDNKQGIDFRFCEETNKELYSLVIGLPEKSNLYFCHGENEEKLFGDIRTLIRGYRPDIQVFSEQIKLMELYFKKISSTDMRKTVLDNNYNSFIEYIPEHCLDKSRQIWDILKGQSQERPKYKALGIFIG